jgi:short-subunit dehydrogenase
MTKKTPQTRFVRLGAQRFGPWALITGASSGIGAEFARQVAANGINVVLAARRTDILDNQIGPALARTYGVQYRAVPVDLAQPDALGSIVAATGDLDVGLVISNAGDMLLGELLAHSHEDLLAELRLNTEAHLNLTRHFGQAMAARGSGGLLLVSSTAALQASPYSANYSAAKSYVMLLGEAVHRELNPRGVRVSVLAPGATDTPMLHRFAAGSKAVLKMAQTPQDCVSEGLTALRANKAVQISGRVNRMSTAMTTRSLRSRLFGNLTKSMADKAATAAKPTQLTTMEPK